MKLPTFFINSAFRKLFRYSHCLHILRKNHFEPMKHKLIYKPVVKSKEKELLHLQLLESLQKHKTVEEQIKAFVSLVKLPEDDIKLRYSICRDLEKILQPYFPSCRVHLIGSSVNGLGTKGCDADLSIELSVENILRKSMRHEGVSEDVNEVLNSESKINPKILLLTIRKILQNSKWDEPLVVIPGRCPILHFTAQNVQFDLSVNNRSAYDSTKLMQLCVELDERITPLMQIIIYWAKHSKIVGGPLKFKTYAVFLMVVFFLQTRSPPILPSIETIFEKAEFLENLESWSYNVEQYLNRFEKTQNNETVEQLLRDFFFFYGNFDFSYILCPRNSIVVDRTLFSSEIDLTKKFELNTISIQDPLNLEWNVTTGVNWKNCKNFMKAIISVCEKYQDKKCWIPGSDSWGLVSLINSEFSYASISDIKEMSIDVPISPVSVNDSIQRNLSDILEQAVNNVKHIFSYCLLFQCHLINQDTNLSLVEVPPSAKSVLEKLIFKRDKDSSIKNTKILLSDLKQNGYPCLIAQYLFATQDTWSGRNTFKSVHNLKENAYEIEHDISQKLTQNRGINEKEIFYFLCECYGVYIENSVCLHMEFKPLNNDRFIPKLAVFLKEYIPKLMDKASLIGPEVNST